MKILHRKTGRKWISFLLVLVMIVSLLPGGVALADSKQGISIATTAITPQTTSIEIHLGQAITGGFAKIVELDSSEEYVDTKLFSYTGLSDVIGYKSLKAGSNQITLREVPTEGKKLYAVLHDSSNGTDNMVTYVSEPVTVTKEGTAGSTAPTPDEIMAGCTVAITNPANGKIKTTDAKQVQVEVNLHESIKSCRLILASYPSTVSFDPDSSATAQLANKTITAGGTYALDFTKDLKVGQNVVAYLYVCVDSEKEWYKQKVSEAITVVNEQGEGFQEYTYPAVEIAETELKAGDTKLHINFSADDRLLGYAKDDAVDFRMTVSIYQYPDGKTFDFEEDYMRQLISPMNVTENLSNYEITLKEGLKAGYRVRAVVYWTQNAALYIPKGNDYEAAGIPDDSVLIPAEQAAPTLTLGVDKIKAGSNSVVVTVAGTVAENSVLIVRQFATDNPKSEDWELFGSYPNATAGMLTVEKNAYGKELKEGKYLAAVLISGGDVVAYSNAIPVVSASYVETPLLTANGTVTEGDTTVCLKVSNTGAIPTGKGIIQLYRADSDGKVDVWGEPELVGSLSPVVSGDSVSVGVSKSIKAGDVIIPYIFYYDSDADKTNYYPGTAFTVQAKKLGDSLVITPNELKAETESIAVTVNGYDSLKGGFVFAKLLDSATADVDAGTLLGSQSFTGSNSYTFLTKDKLKAGKYVLVYLYRYDSDADKIYYSDKVVKLVGGTVEKEPVVEITSSKILSTDKSFYVKTDFDSTLAGTLDLYMYPYSGAFQMENTQNVKLTSKTVTPSTYGQKVEFSMDLTAGNQLVAVLTVNGKTENGNENGDENKKVVKVSAAKTIQAPPQIVSPTAYITEETISEGDVKLHAYINFEKNYYDRVEYVLYNYTGDTLNEKTAKVLANSTMYSPGNTSIYFKSGTTPLEVDSKLVIQLTLVKNDVPQVVYSNVRNVEAAPDWATPTVSIDVAAVRVGDASIPVTVTYDKGYTEMKDYYCTVTAFQFPSTYSDAEFEEKELSENTTITKRIGTYSADKDKKEQLTKVNIPVSGTLKAGDRLIVKLRLPHPEWADEEADYLSISVPVIGANETVPVAKVLLFNLGSDTETGGKIRTILSEMGIQTVTVEQKDLDQKVGYLAGLNGFTEEAEDYTGEAYTTEFLLMSHLSETQLDQFLAEMSTAGVSIGHKAVVTETNKEWTFRELIAEIEEEHETMQAWTALGNVIKQLETLKADDYDAAKWKEFQDVLADAKLLYQYEAAAKDYRDAIDALKEAYEALTGEPFDKEEAAVEHRVTIQASYATVTGAGSYQSGETVTISAGSRSGYRFVGWESEEVTVNNASSAETTFVMPEHDVTVTALWKKQSSSGSSSGSYSGSSYSKQIVMQIGKLDMQINGKTISSDVAPMIWNGRTMVPIRVVTETLGGTADWNEASRTVTLHIGGKTLTMTIDQVMEGFDTAPMIFQSRTYVPIRYVAEKLGVQVQWMEDSQKLLLASR